MQDFHDGLFGPDLVKDDDNDKQLDKPLFQLAREGDIESMQAVLSRYSVGFIRNSVRYFLQTCSMKFCFSKPHL